MRRILNSSNHGINHKLNGVPVIHTINPKYIRYVFHGVNTPGVSYSAFLQSINISLSNMTIEFKEVQKQIELVKEDIQRRFPGCSYTVGIILWDDSTFQVDCRYGTDDMIYRTTWYADKTTFDEIPLTNYHQKISLDDNKISFHIKNCF